MGKCLVTKLMGNVDNDNLPVLGELVIDVQKRTVSSPNEISSALKLSTNDIVDVYVDNGGYFADTFAGLDIPESRLTTKTIGSNDGLVEFFVKNMLFIII